jgi:hypothetical protein
MCNIAQMFLNYENPTVKDLGIPPKGMYLNLGEHRSKNSSPPPPGGGGGFFFCGGGGGLIMVCYNASSKTKLQNLPSTPGYLSWTCSSGRNRHGPVSISHTVWPFSFSHVFVPFYFFLEDIESCQSKAAFCRIMCLINHLPGINMCHAKSSLSTGYQHVSC